MHSTTVKKPLNTQLAILLSRFGSLPILLETEWVLRARYGYPNVSSVYYSSQVNNLSSFCATFNEGLQGWCV
jgi:hypothetical protein